ncbi:hypothetical protein DOTSEDRAFT_27147 [Dothistroma septosporum NZE10]|uniref:Uncharacterized protein n=1 Tax=Dothistroma septosporum (strain NZE10 / CBS 128990) TaxID=675120 RepID=N1PD34_DOTSN|nr:hypothetical protein DOTSEDRAFT_27147 [Dothistroma septosporum NZE10]
MYTSAFLTAAFAALAFAGQQGVERREACEPNCDSDRGDYRPDSWGRGGGGGGGFSGGYVGGSSQDWQRHGGGFDGGRDGRFDPDGDSNYNYDTASGRSEYHSGSFSSGGYNQIPLHFDGNQRDVPIDQLYNYDNTCSSIRFPQDDPCQQCEGDWQKLRCIAYGDSEGRDQIGNAFNYNDGCDFGSPTHVVTLRCTYNN